MGIPGFNIWFSEKYGNAYIPLGKVRVDHLYIDLNSVLHTVMRRAKDHDHFHKLLHKRLHQILDTTQPTKSVMIAVDGPAPLAKLLTQRDRRKKTGRSVDAGETLTGAAITPGTTFMLDLTHSLAYFCCNKLSSRRFRNLVFELSDGNVMGEGEVKVLGRLARHWYPSDPSDTHVILGDDADLILMALTSYKENLFVANSGLNDGRLDARVPVFSVNLLHGAWAQQLLARVVQAGQVPLEQALLHAKLDLTLIAIMSKGNDYLPGVRGVALEEGPSGGLWPCYQKAVSKYQAVKNGGLARGPLGGADSVTSIDPATGTPRLHAGALAHLLRMASSCSGGAAGSDGWLGSKSAADPQVYLRGCVWLLQMYLTGECPDYRFYYDGVAPTASALCAACEAVAASGSPYITLDTFGARDPRAPSPLLPVACALALLPANCKHLAAPCVRHLMAGPASEGITGGALDGELYYDLYGVCDECLSMSTEVSRLQKAITHARALRTTAAKRLEAVQAGTAPLGEASPEQLQAEITSAEEDYELAKSQLQELERRRKNHISTAHPYRRFPVERLEQAAAAAVANGHVTPEERPATAFGRPLVLRAFDNRSAATDFIRQQTLTQPSPQGGPFGAGGQSSNPYQHPSFYQQQRQGSSWSQSQQQQQGMFNPPPPPFIAEQQHFFTSIVGQEVLYDEYGSREGVQLRLPLAGAVGFVRYLAARGDMQPHQQGGQQRRQRQSPAPKASSPPGGQQGAPQAQVPRPPPPRKRQELVGGAAAAAAAAATAAAATAASSAAASSAAAAAASQCQTSVAVAVTATVAVPAPSSSSRRPAVVVGAAAAAAAAAGPQPASPGPNESGEEQGGAATRKRGRPRGSKKKQQGTIGPTAGSDGGPGGTAARDMDSAGAAAAAPMTATAAAATAAAVVAVTSSHTSYGTQHTTAAAPPPPPMPSTRLLSMALSSAAQAAYPSAPAHMPGNQQQPYNPFLYGKGQAYGQLAGQKGYGGQPVAPSPVYGGPTGGHVHGSSRAPPVVPVLLRPASPPPAVAAAAAAAVAATAQGRVRTGGTAGPRWS